MKDTLGQLFRYGIVGVLSNVFLYLLYLGITEAGMEHKLAMTLLYAAGVIQSFAFNRTWSFRHNGTHGPAFARYVMTYGLGYLVNLAALYFFADRLGWPHEVVQASMVLVVAVLLFVLQKFWVFRHPGGAVPRVVP